MSNTNLSILAKDSKMLSIKDIKYSHFLKFKIFRLLLFFSMSNNQFFFPSLYSQNLTFLISVYFAPQIYSNDYLYFFLSTRLYSSIFFNSYNMQSLMKLW